MLQEYKYSSEIPKQDYDKILQNLATYAATGEINNDQELKSLVNRNFYALYMKNEDMTRALAEMVGLDFPYTIWFLESLLITDYYSDKNNANCYLTDYIRCKKNLTPKAFEELLALNRPGKAWAENYIEIYKRKFSKAEQEIILKYLDKIPTFKNDDVLLKLLETLNLGDSDDYFYNRAILSACLNILIPGDQVRNYDRFISIIKKALNVSFVYSEINDRVIKGFVDGNKLCKELAESIPSVRMVKKLIELAICKQEEKFIKAAEDYMPVMKAKNLTFHSDDLIASVRVNDQIAIRLFNSAIGSGLDTGNGVWMVAMAIQDGPNKDLFLKTVLSQVKEDGLGVSDLHITDLQNISTENPNAKLILDALLIRKEIERKAELQRKERKLRVEHMERKKLENTRQRNQYNSMREEKGARLALVNKFIKDFNK